HGCCNGNYGLGLGTGKLSNNRSDYRFSRKRKSNRCDGVASLQPVCHKDIKLKCDQAIVSACNKKARNAQARRIDKVLPKREGASRRGTACTKRCNRQKGRLRNPLLQPWGKSHARYAAYSNAAAKGDPQEKIAGFINGFGQEAKGIAKRVCPNTYEC
ncbi:MAG: hypothetical protein IJ131_02680, partial [Eggerthellaceae bacterium]|nr:hypothetical protein [Eggerthellaceae bacterium]